MKEITSKQYRELIGSSQGYCKYNNKKTVLDGRCFSSLKEAGRYAELKMLQQYGQIYDLKMQERFLLQGGFEKNGIKYNPIYYICDFSYKLKNGDCIIEDVKASVNFKTPIYRLKKKLFERKYPSLTIKEIY